MTHIKRYLFPYTPFFIGIVDLDIELSNRLDYSSTSELGQDSSRKRNGKYMPVYDDERDVLVERGILRRTTYHLAYWRCLYSLAVKSGCGTFRESQACNFLATRKTYWPSHMFIGDEGPAYRTALVVALQPRSELIRSLSVSISSVVLLHKSFQWCSCTAGKEGIAKMYHKDRGSDKNDANCLGRVVP